jgi:hypothetical protein
VAEQLLAFEGLTSMQLVRVHICAFGRRNYKLRVNSTILKLFIRKGSVSNLRNGELYSVIPEVPYFR